MTSDFGFEFNTGDALLPMAAMMKPDSAHLPCSGKIAVVAGHGTFVYCHLLLGVSSYA